MEYIKRFTGHSEKWGTYDTQKFHKPRKRI